MKKKLIFLIPLFLFLFLNMEDCPDESELSVDKELDKVRINLLEWKTLSYADQTKIDIKYHGGFENGANNIGWFAYRYEGEENKFFAQEGYVFDIKDIKLKVKDVEYDYAIVCLTKRGPQDEVESSEETELLPTQVAEQEKQVEKTQVPGRTAELSDFRFDSLKLKRGDMLLIGEIGTLYETGGSYRIRLVEFDDFYDCVDQDFISKYKDDYIGKIFAVLIRGKKAVKLKLFKDLSS